MFRNFVFDMECLNKLARHGKRQRQEQNSPISIWLMNSRQLYVRFVLNFFRHGDTLLKKDVLEIKGFVQTIIKNLPYDDNVTALYALDVFHDDILEDSRLSRTLKLSLFSTATLNALLQLYDRNGSSEEDVFFSQRLHQVLLDLTTKRGKGVCFVDRGWYPRDSEGSSDIYYNKILSQWIHYLRPFRDLRQQALLLLIFQSCPELVVCYWKTSTYHIGVELSIEWCTKIALLTKIIQLKPPLLQKNHAPPQFIVMANILPSVVQKSLIGHALYSKNFFVRWMMINFLIVVLKKLHQVCELVTNFESDMWKTFQRDIINETSRNLPDLQLILSSYHSLASLKIETSKSPSHVLLHSRYLKLIQLWRHLFPSGFLEARYEPGKLMSSYRDEGSLRQLIRTFTEFHELKILPDMTCWLDFYSNMEMEDSQFRSLEKMLIRSFMETGIFDDSSMEDEILVWLCCLRKVKLSCTTLLSNAVSEAFQHGLTYLDSHRRLLNLSGISSHSSLLLSPFLSIILQFIQTNAVADTHWQQYLEHVIKQLILVGVNRSSILVVLNLFPQQQGSLYEVIKNLMRNVDSKEFEFDDYSENINPQIYIRQCASYLNGNVTQRIDPGILDKISNSLVVNLCAKADCASSLKPLIDSISTLVSKKLISISLCGK